MSRIFSGISVIGGQALVQSITGTQLFSVNPSNNTTTFNTLQTSTGVQNTILTVTGIDNAIVNVSPIADVIEVCSVGSGINTIHLANGVETQKIKIIYSKETTNSQVYITFVTSSLGGNTRVELSDVGETVSLCYTPAGWVVVEGNGHMIGGV